MKQHKIIFLAVLLLFAGLLLTACSLSRTSAAGSESGPSALSAAPSSVVGDSPAPSADVSPSPAFSPAPEASVVPDAVSCTPEPEQASAEVLSLWCLENAASSELIRYAMLFNDSSADVTVQVTVFSNEEALSAALASSTPDLLFCKRFLPEELNLSVSAFDLLGYEVPVLLINNAALEQVCGSASALDGCSFNRLCEIAAAAPSGTPFLAASSFTSVFENCLLSCGSRLSADRSANVGNPDYISIYNLLAECAWSGNLVTYVQDLSSFRASGTVCMFTSSLFLSGQDLTDLTISPFPLPEGASDLPACTAAEHGFAVLSGSPAEPEKARSFFSWLQENGFSSSLALSSGLIPASPSGEFVSDALSAVLNTVYSEYRLVTPDDSRLSGEDREAFDLECRTTFSSF